MGRANDPTTDDRSESRKVDNSILNAVLERRGFFRRVLWEQIRLSRRIWPSLDDFNDIKIEK